MMISKASKETKQEEIDAVPLVRYRKKDAERIRQIDEMQDDVVSKIGDVMASFKEKPARSEQLEANLLKSRASHVQPVQVPEKKYDPASYIIMIFLSLVLIIVLFVYVLF